MSEEERAARYEELEAAVWHSGYRGGGAALDAVLDALQGYVLALVDDRIVDAQRARVAEMDELREQVRRMPRSVGMGQGPGDLSERADFVPGGGAGVENAAFVEAMERADRYEAQDATEIIATDGAPDPYPEPEEDPYGDALLEALEEAAQEAEPQLTPQERYPEFFALIDQVNEDPAYEGIEPDPQPTDLVRCTRFHLTETDTIRIHPDDVAILREYLRDGTGDAYEQALQARDVIGLEVLSRTELVEAVKDAVAADPEVVLTGVAQPWPRPCRTCGEVLGKDGFKPDRSMADGYRSDCRACIRKRNKERLRRKAQETEGAPTA